MNRIQYDRSKSRGLIWPLRLVARDIGPYDAPVALQLPVVIRAVGKPIGDTRLRVHLTAGHGDARLFAVGNDLFQTKLTAVAQNGDEGDEHRDLPR